MVDFLVIGPVGAVIYRDIFPLIKNGNVSSGWNRVVEFEDGVKFGNIRWFSNISDYCIPPFEFKRQYKDSDYKKFDNYDAIYIKKSEDIPDGYYGVMGVPITFIDKWNPEQFEVIGFGMNGSGGDDMFAPIVEGDYKFRRLLIKKKIS